MASQLIAAPYVQADGTIIRHYVCDTDTERDALATTPGAMAISKESGTMKVSGTSTWTPPVATGPGGEAFPVGAVFISVVSTDPATLLGYGTWSAFGAGRVMVGLDTGDAAFDTVEETGGAQTSAVSAHSGSAVANHSFTQPSGHSNHAVTQPANHVFTQPSGHSAHNVTQPAAHSNHAVGQPTAHGTLSHTSGADSSTTGGVAKATAATVHTLTNNHTGATVDAHSAHSATAVDAHSAHAGGAVDAHSATAIDAHSAHAGGAVDAHGVTQPSAHTDLSVVQPYIVAYFWKRTA